ncbi:MAG: ferrous iron transport protein B [Planctomycetes bacterium]|nr:ferrous iron transport protein B [Planctomycetota bacterium]
MMSDSATAKVAAFSATRRIAVAGNPNSGKTTLFNHLTGLRQKVANYPGVTVEKREGMLSGTDIALLDLPGTYSLSARSPDEEIARDVLLGRIAGMPRPDAILLVIDASNLERNLYLATQIVEFGTPVVIACNMIDMVEQRGHRISCAELSRELGVPVIPTSAKKRRGFDEIRSALMHLEGRVPCRRPWKLSAPFEDAVERNALIMERSGVIPSHAVRAGSLLWLIDYLSGEAAGRASAERFLGKLSNADAESLRATAAELMAADADAAATAIEARYAWISEVSSRVVSKSTPPGANSGDAPSLTDRIDSVLTHRLLGFAVFAAVMFALFLSIFSWAEPLMGWIEAGQAALADWTGAVINEGPLQSLLVDGVINGVGSVVIFLPQICILFLFLSILEDSGYMARAAFLMDRLMARVGLHGRSFIPLLSSYACAIPGIMATRTIENQRDRLTTILIAPLMSCSARPARLFDSHLSRIRQPALAEGGRHVRFVSFRHRRGTAHGGAA